MSRRFREVDRWVAIAQKAGWRVRMAGSAHVVFYPLSGEMITVSRSASDHRASVTAKVQLRRAGLDI